MWLLHAAAGGGGVRTSPPGAEELGSASSSDTPVPSVCPPPHQWGESSAKPVGLLGGAGAVAWGAP